MSYLIDTSYGQSWALVATVMLISISVAAKKFAEAWKVYQESKAVKIQVGGEKGVRLAVKEAEFPIEGNSDRKKRGTGGD